MKRLLLALAIVTLGSGVVIAAPDPKVFVCKYVGTPGVDERLQTGNNPISVSQNAIANFQGVGSSFNDAQGRSLVIALDTGQDEPQCPVPEIPEVPTPPVVTPPVTEPPATPQPAVETPIVHIEACIGKCG